MPDLTITTEQPQITGVRLVDALMVGPWQENEFLLATRSLEHWNDNLHLATVAAACDHLAHLDIAPELIFLAQPLPSLVRQDDVDRLQQLAPLARIVVVAGTWCEGELRTGYPPTGVLRLYWYELASWWQAAMRRLAAGQCPSWSLPLDHLQAGRYCSESSWDDLRQTVAIDAEDFSVFETIAESLQFAKATPIWANHDSYKQATAGIFDGGQLDARQLDRLQQFSAHIDGKVTLLLDFPRREHLDQARSAGASAVFGKPYVVEEVLASLV